MKGGASKAEQWLQRFAHENPDSVLLWGVDGARQAALVAIFYKAGWTWKDGVPHHPKVSIGQATTRCMKSAVTKASWIDPLKRNGEETLEGFLKNNLAASSFMAALVQTLSMARRPQKEAEEIVRRAAEKMYPDYVKRLRALSAMAVEGVVLTGRVENLCIPKPADGCLLCSIPENVEQAWRELAAEALALPKKIHDRFGKETKKEVIEAQKWTDKMLKSLRKKGLVSLV